MAGVNAILLEPLFLRLDGAGNICGVIFVQELIEQLSKIKPDSNNGSIKFTAEKRRAFNKDHTHMPPLCIQWSEADQTSRTESSHTQSPSNGHTVKQSAPDEEL